MHRSTPLLRSDPLSDRFGAEVWLKLENLQPSGSFKLRGLGLASERAVTRGARRLVIASGGNAGLAVAWAGRELRVPVTVVVPVTTGAPRRDLLRSLGAEVEVEGAAWDEAHLRAAVVAEEQGGALLHPFDDPVVWEGHATLVAECAAELAEPPGTVVVAVGGGGLLCGVLQGMHDAGWSDVPVVAAETEGAASYAAALAAGEPVTLPAITSIATTLGAKRVCDRAVAWANVHPIRSALCTDGEAVLACRRFADDHRLLVEPACGAALAVLPGIRGAGSILVIVCGGAGVTLAELEAWTRLPGTPRGVVP
jgi:L-serine/L-threonine ammonia-lyase